MGGFCIHDFFFLKNKEKASKSILWEIGDHKTDDIYPGKISLVEFPEYVGIHAMT